MADINQIITDFGNSLANITANIGNFNTVLNNSSNAFNSVSAALNSFITQLNTQVPTPQAQIDNLNIAFDTIAKSSLDLSDNLSNVINNFGNFNTVLTNSSNTFDGLITSLNNFTTNLTNSNNTFNSLITGFSNISTGLAQTNAMFANFTTLTQNLSTTSTALNNFVKQLNTQLPKPQPQQAPQKREQAKSIFEAKNLGDVFNTVSKTAISFSNEVVKIGGRVAGAGVGAAVGGAIGAAGGPIGAGVGARVGAAAGGIAADVGFKSLLGTVGLLNTVVKLSVSEFTKLAGSITTFVGAFNPALVQIFSLALKDLTAVIGSGLQPILSSLTNIVRTFADALVPIIGAMEPVFRTLAAAIENFLLPIIQAFTTVLAKAQPQLLQMAQAINRIAQILGGVFADAIEMTYPLMIEFAVILANLVKDLTPVISMLIKAVYIIQSVVMTVLVPVFSFIGRLIGNFGKFLEKVIDDLTFGLLRNKQRQRMEQTGESRGFAAQQARYMSVEEISKQAIQAAFGFGTRNIEQRQLDEQKKANAFLERIAAAQGKPVGPVFQQGPVPGARP